MLSDCLHAVSNSDIRRQRCLSTVVREDTDHPGQTFNEYWSFPTISVIREIDIGQIWRPVQSPRLMEVHGLTLE